MRSLLSFTFLLALPLTAAPLADVSMRFSGTRPVVEVRVNGRGPFLFLLDTGAAGVAWVDVSLVERLHLAAEGQQESSDAGAATHATLKQFHLASLALGDYELRDVTAYSRNYNGVRVIERQEDVGEELEAEDAVDRRGASACRPATSPRPIPPWRSATEIRTSRCGSAAGRRRC